MALADHSELLTTLYGLQGAKKSGNQQQYDIFKQQFRNDLLNIQLKNRTSSLTQLQSAYDKQQKAYEDIAEKTDIFNRQMEFFRNPQKYPAWQSNPYISANMLGADPQVVGYARDRDLLNKLPPQYQNALRAGVLGGDGGVQNRILNNDLLNQQQAHPIVQQNIASIGTGTTAEQNTAIAAYNNSQANLTKAQTAQSESVQGKLALIDISYPKSDDAQQQLMRGIAIAKAFGIDENLAAALGIAKDDELVSYLLAQAGASDPVQNVQAGIEPYAPQRPTNPVQSPGDKGRAEYEKDKAAFDASIAFMPEGEAKEALRQQGYAELARKHGSIPQPKAEGAGGGISTIQKEHYRGLVNIAIATANRFNLEGLPDGESPEFGELAILIALQNALTSDQLAGSSTEDLNAFAQIFTAELGEAIKQAGTEDPSAISQSMLNLVTNGAQLHQKVLAALNVAKQKGGSFTLADLGFSKEEIDKMAVAAMSLSQDPNLLQGITQLIPDLAKRISELQQPNLNPEQFAPTTPPKPAFSGELSTIPGGSQTDGVKKHYFSGLEAVDGIRSGQVIQFKGQRGIVDYTITELPKQAGGKFKAVPFGAQRNFAGKYGNGVEVEFDKSLILPRNLQPNDKVVIYMQPGVGGRRPYVVTLLSLASERAMRYQHSPTESISIPDGYALIQTEEGNIFTIPIAEIAGKLSNDAI